MKKKELIERMARDACITKVAAADALDSLIDGLTAAIKNDDGKMTLTGLGTFTKTHRKAYNGRNPRTGEPVRVKARNTVRFKAAKALNDSVLESETS